MKQVAAWTIGVERHGDRVALPGPYPRKWVNYLTPVWV